MANAKFLDVLNMRFHGLQIPMTTSTVVNWDPFNEGSYLHLYFNNSSVAATVNITVPTVSGMSWPSGYIIWVCAEVGYTGASIVWDSNFKFQTVGDEQPNTTSNSQTLWMGFCMVDLPGIILMTKFGEWT